MTLRMWVVETDQYSATDRKFYIDDPSHIPRVGEFVDGDFAGGWVHHVQWNISALDRDIVESKISTVYVYLKREKNG